MRDSRIVSGLRFGHLQADNGLRKNGLQIQRLVSSGNLVRGGTGWVRLHEVSLGDRCTTRGESALGRE